MVSSTITILGTFILLYANYSRFYNNQLQLTATSILDDSSKMIHNEFASIEKLSDTIMFQQFVTDYTVISIFEQEANKIGLSDYEKLMNNRKLAYVANSFTYSNDFINGIYLFTKNSDIYSFSKGDELDFDNTASGTDWYKATLASKGRLNITSVKPYIFFSRSVIDLNSGKNLGVLLVVCNNKILSNIGHNITPGNYISVTDKNGDLLYSNESNIKSHSIDSDMLKIMSGNQRGYFYKPNEYYSYNTIAYNGWKVIVKLSMVPFIAEFKNNMYYTLLVLAVFLIISFIISIVFSNMFSEPIINLSKIMAEGDIKNSDIDEHYLTRKDEIGMLYNRFNKMLYEINRLIKDEYENKIILLNSKIKVLTSQINSHFIFNTLESINSLAIIEGVSKISIMSKSLGDILRYYMDNHTDIVELNDELRQVRAYLSIQEIRFNRKIYIEINSTPELLKEKVLKFILQPIVENSVSHGFDRDSSIWKLTINAFLDDRNMNIKIYDNGVGITEDKLSYINNSLKVCTRIQDVNNKNSHGIGLMNVNSRIKLYYGDAYGINIESNKGTGTCTNLIISKNLND